MVEEKEVKGEEREERREEGEEGVECLWLASAQATVLTELAGGNKLDRSLLTNPWTGRSALL